MIDPPLIHRIMPRAGHRAEVYAPLLEAAREKWVGPDPAHVAMWLAQLAHESGELKYTLELADGTDYEGRGNLGNTQPGDGPRFRGRGLIQLTGRDNYKRAGEAMGLPLLENPELLQQPDHAASVAGWFWFWSGCATRMLSDDPLLSVTRRINGGLKGLENRRTYWERAQRALLGRAEQAAPITEAVPVYTKTEEPVAPILAAVLPTIVQAIPELTRIFGSGSATAERNAQAVERVAQIVTAATESVNVQQAAERVQKDPAARAVAQDAIRREYFDLIKLSEQSIAAAREFNNQWNNGEAFIKTPYIHIKFVELLSLVLVLIGAAGAFVVLRDPSASPELKAAVITLVLIGGFVAVYQFWLGSSRDSQRKTEIMSR